MWVPSFCLDSASDELCIKVSPPDALYQRRFAARHKLKDFKTTDCKQFWKENMLFDEFSSVAIPTSVYYISGKTDSFFKSISYLIFGNASKFADLRSNFIGRIAVLHELDNLSVSDMYYDSDGITACGINLFCFTHQCRVACFDSLSERWQVNDMFDWYDGPDFATFIIENLAGLYQPVKTLKFVDDNIRQRNIGSPLNPGICYDDKDDTESNLLTENRYNVPFGMLGFPLATSTPRPYANSTNTGTLHGISMNSVSSELIADAGIVGTPIATSFNETVSGT